MNMKGFKDVIILFLIAAIAGACLSFVYISTKERIAEVKRKELQAALKKVLPFLKDEHTKIDYKYEDETVSIYSVEEDGAFKGAALKMISSEGFSGNITFLMGVNNDNKITGFYMLDHKETPGLGTKAAKKKFWGQFINKSLNTFKFKVTKDKGDVEAITAATITSRAISTAMGKGLRIFQQYQNSRGEI